MKVHKYEWDRDEELLKLFEETLLASPYQVEFNKHYWAEWIKIVKGHPDLYSIIVAERDNMLVGILVGQIYFGHPLIQFSKIAMELFWYVKPEHRGLGAFKMVNLYEQWAKEVGATHVCMSLLSNKYEAKLDRLYRAKHYSPLEKQYIKEIKYVSHP